MREDGTSIYYNYDTAARLTAEDWLDSSSAGLYAYEYEYDAAGNRARLTKDAVTTCYAYNSLNQLTRTEDTLGALTYYEYQADGATSRKHDATGWTYFTWDVDEALRRLEFKGASLTMREVSTYDAEMKRVKVEDYSDQDAPGVRPAPASVARRKFGSPSALRHRSTQSPIPFPRHMLERTGETTGRVRAAR